MITKRDKTPGPFQYIFPVKRDKQLWVRAWFNGREHPGDEVDSTLKMEEDMRGLIEYS